MNCAQTINEWRKAKRSVVLLRRQAFSWIKNISNLTPTEIKRQNYIQLEMQLFWVCINKYNYIFFKVIDEINSSKFGRSNSKMVSIVSYFSSWNVCFCSIRQLVENNDEITIKYQFILNIGTKDGSWFQCHASFCWRGMYFFLYFEKWQLVHKTKLNIRKYLYILYSYSLSLIKKLFQHRYLFLERNLKDSLFINLKF